jgi:hypothetical protein
MNLNVISFLWACPFGSCFSFQVLVPAGFSLQSLTHFFFFSFFLFFFNKNAAPKKNSKKISKVVFRRSVSKGNTSAPSSRPCFTALLPQFFVLSFFSFFLLGLLLFCARALPPPRGLVSGFVWFFFLFVVVVASSSSVLPSGVVRVLSGARSFGFCGSRSVVPPPSVWSSVVSVVPPSSPVSCGCVAGLCALARSSFSSVSVFSASSFGFGRGSFAARSVALVRSVRSGSLPLWVSFPAVACPVGLVPSSSPSRCFCGLGSGSWASLAFACGLGLPALLFLPAGVRPPAGWGFFSLGSGWFFRP